MAGYLIVALVNFWNVALIVRGLRRCRGLRALPWLAMAVPALPMWWLTLTQHGIAFSLATLVMTVAGVWCGTRGLTGQAGSNAEVPPAPSQAPLRSPLAVAAQAG